MQSVIDFIFNVLNVVLRIGLTLFLIRKYAVRRVDQAVSYDKISFDLLEEEHTKFKKACQDTQQDIGQQDLLYHDLHTKFLVWQNTIHSKQEQEKFIYTIQQQKVQEKIERKQLYLHKRNVMKHEIPDVVQQVTHDLQHEFQHDVDLSKSYIAKVLEALK